MSKQLKVAYTAQDLGDLDGGLKGRSIKKRDNDTKGKFVINAAINPFTTLELIIQKKRRQLKNEVK